MKSRLLPVSLFAQFSKLWKLLTFYTTGWTIKSQFTWSLVSMPGCGRKACLCTLWHASSSCGPLLVKSCWILSFWNPGLSDLGVIWVRGLELTVFSCYLKGGLKDHSEKWVNQSSNRNSLSDQLASVFEILTWQNVFLPNPEVWKFWGYVSKASCLKEFFSSFVKWGY